MDRNKRARGTPNGQHKEEEENDAATKDHPAHVNNEQEEEEDSSGTESDELDFYPGQGLESDSDSDSDSGSESEQQQGHHGGVSSSSATGAASGNKRKRSHSDSHEANKEENLVNVDFSFSDPQENQFHSIKQFLTRYLPGMEQSFPSSQLAEVIVKQASVGTMVTTEESPDAYAFITAVNMHWHKQLGAVKEFKKYILQKCPEDGTKQKLEALFNKESEPFGLLFNERMVNMPPEIAPHMLSNFLEDLKWAIENEISEDHRNKFKFRKIMLIAPCFKDKDGDVEYFLRFEEELMDAISEISFSFPVGTSNMTNLESGKENTDVTVPQTRRVIVFDADNLPDIVGKVQSLVEQASQQST